MQNLVSLKTSRYNDEIIAYLSHIARMMKGWRSNVYAFFQPTPEVVYRKDKKTHKDRKCHVFTCLGRGCQLKDGIARYMDTGDSQSTSNLRKHVKLCKGWGEEVLKTVEEAENVQVAREKITDPFRRNGTITTLFERNNKSKVTYSPRAHTKTETR